MMAIPGSAVCRSAIACSEEDHAMSESILARRARGRLRQERLDRAAAQAAAATAEAEAAHDAWLDRNRVAARLGITPRRLRQWMAAGRGPRFEKLGEFAQSPVRWRAEEVAAWLAGPAAYEAAKRG